MSQDNHTLFDIDEYLKQLPLRPGVYRMFDAVGEVIYVGKAVNLKIELQATSGAKAIILRRR